MTKIAKVLIESSAAALDCLFDYRIPDEWVPLAGIGARVIVPLQNRLTLGFIWGLDDHSDYTKIKSVSKIIDIPPLISSYQHQLVEWIAQYYFCNRSEVVRLCLPPGSKLKKEKGLQLAVPAEEVLSRINAAFGEITAENIRCSILKAAASMWSQEEWQEQFGEYPEVLQFLILERLVTPTMFYGKSRVKHKKIDICRWADTCETEKTAAGERVRKLLLENQAGLTRSQICAGAAVSPGVVSRLIREAKISVSQSTIDRLPDGFSLPLKSVTLNFNPEQAAAYQQIHQDPASRPFLLHGVTGSGKTEIYFELAEQAIKKGQQVLYLVPEISLTPQTLARARNRFGDEVALLHSNMSDGERYDQWFKIKENSARFILGARSALFAPFHDLGLIIVDEEHETTYKQEEVPRYHTHEVVQKIAELTGAKAVFGSATPAIESFYYARTGKFHYIALEQRFNRNPLPEVTLVDMREELKSGNRNILSEPLVQALKTCLESHEQAILLLNRRGHSTFVMCRDCGESLRCPSCDVSLTYHSHETILRCHYCDYRQKIPNICPKCQSTRIRYFGHGTQKLEAELNEMFPEARVIRMDLDSTSKKGAHQRIYQQLADGEVDILLGTQMIAKGLDLPRVTLVGVISADSTLNMPDFRSAERAFQLLTQVAGRAGRGSKPGHVIFQTYNPDHYALQFAKNHDYKGFYETEIQNRRLLNYPPFSELLKIGFSGEEQNKVIEAADLYGKLLKEKIHKIASDSSDKDFIEILGPAPALIEKIQNRYRHQVIIKTNRPEWLYQIATETWVEFPFKKYSTVRVIRDRNPYSIL